jgi:DNA repair photolyase
VIAFGGTCDAYHPAEDLGHITEKLLKIVLKYRYPLVLSTKATLIQRDFPLLDAIGEAAYCTVGFTITTMDPQIAKFLEPRVDFGIKRLDLIRKIRSHYPHIQVGINFMPMIPLLEDTEANIESIISKSAAAGAQFVQGGPGVTLRDRQADFFYQAFEQYNPNLYQQFRMFWKNNPPNSPYYREKNQFFRDICLKYQIPMRAKRWIPNDFRKENYLIAEDLLNRAYYAQIGGQPYSDMQWAGFTIQNLKENLFHLLEKQELTQIITPRNATDRVRIIIAEYHKSHTPESGLDHFLNKSK